MDGQSYQISMKPTFYRDKVVPESFRILLRKYLGKLEVKSSAPDGTPCTATTRGVLQRARITASKLVPVGKETDRHWEHCDDPSMVDSDIYIYEKRTRLVVADPTWRMIERVRGRTGMPSVALETGVWLSLDSLIKRLTPMASHLFRSEGVTA